MGRNNYRRLLMAAILLSLLLLSMIIVRSGQVTALGEEDSPPPALFIPLVSRALDCPETSTNHYTAGTAFQVDRDNPVRPAWNHADKNLALRGYTPNTNGDFYHQLVNYGSGDPNGPPQFATLFNPARVPDLIGFYRVGQWNWAPSPDPGQRGSPITFPKITALGLKTNPGEAIHVPTSGYDIGGGMEVLILYAGENSVTLRYTREDSSAIGGYSVFVDNICTDPNLLALYRQLDDPNGPRYKYSATRPYAYNLPNLPAGHPLGTAKGGEVVVAISDTGRFWDPRSCNEWWRVRPGYSAVCPDFQW
jgi:hypothetical protein